MVRPEKWVQIVTKRPGTKRPRDAQSQGRIIPGTHHPIFPGTDNSGTHSSGMQRHGTKIKALTKMQKQKTRVVVPD
jgi:hypothetical protein